MGCRSGVLPGYDGRARIRKEDREGRKTVQCAHNGRNSLGRWLSILAPQELPTGKSIASNGSDDGKPGDRDRVPGGNEKG